MVFYNNKGGVNEEKAILHYNSWDVYMNRKESLIKGGHSVEVLGSDGKKVI